MTDSLDPEPLRVRRDAARNRFVVAVVLLFVLGGGTRLAGPGFAFATAANLLVVLLLTGCLVTGLEWAWRGAALRRSHDPWAYDAELDGPVAQEFEGRRFGPDEAAGRRKP